MRDKELSTAARSDARLKEASDRGKRTGAVLAARKESRRDAPFHQRRGRKGGGDI